MPQPWYSAASAALGCLVLSAAVTPAQRASPPEQPSPPGRLTAPPAPPNGTYTYALTRNGADQGSTTVTLLRRDAVQAFESNEAGQAGAARAFVLASFDYADFGATTYDATYQAPFLRSSALGRALRFRARAPFDAQTTVRYLLDERGARATIDGVPGLIDVSPPGAEAQSAARWIFDAPFMTGALLLPAFRHREQDRLLAPISLAFGTPGTTLARETIERAAARFPKTPKNDLVLNVEGLARIWFDPATYVVHEVHFDALNIDAHLVSYAKSTQPAAFAPLPPATPAPSLPSVEVTFQSADGTTLAGVIDTPPSSAKEAPPTIVLVPEGPAGARDFDSDGPYPMYPDLSAAFAGRGYETLRYDMRGVGRSEGSATDETWSQALADVEAAAEFLESEEDVAPKRLYLLGYGNGADLALAAAAALDLPVAGVVALAPSVVSYRTCAQQEAQAGATPLPGFKAWQKSEAGRDPTVLAARSRVPLFVLHPGVPRCASTPDQDTAYDEQLQAANPRVTAIVASDLSDRFGGRYDADSPADTEEFFPYRFDPSTAGAIADWLDGPKTSGGPSGLPAASGPPAAPPPPPPAPAEGPQRLENPQLRTPLPEPQPGVVLPSPTPAAVATPAPAPGAPVATSPPAPAAPEATPMPAPATPAPSPSG
jgi:pimeloyl-ACP methyl ester carboxylesterase